MTNSKLRPLNSSSFTIYRLDFSFNGEESCTNHIVWLKNIKTSIQKRYINSGNKSFQLSKLHTNSQQRTTLIQSLNGRQAIHQISMVVRRCRRYSSLPSHTSSRSRKGKTTSSTHAQTKYIPNGEKYSGTRRI